MFTPAALISEGLAEYGIKMLFSFDELIQFEKEVLFPLAGLDTSIVGKYNKLRELRDNLKYAQISIARKFVDGKIGETEAVKQLTQFTLVAPSQAESFLEFVKNYKGFIITYTEGYRLIQEYMENDLSDDTTVNDKWKIFYELISTPRTVKSITFGKIKK